MGGTGTPIYWARWVGFDGQTGPWSLPCWTTIKAKAATQMTEIKADDAGVEQQMKLAA